MTGVQTCALPIYPSFRRRISESLQCIVAYNDPSLEKRGDKAKVDRATAAEPHRADTAMLSFLAKDDAQRAEHRVFQEVLRRGSVPIELQDFKI